MLPLKLIVADDHPLLRAAVVHALAEALPGAEMIEAASVATLGQALAAHPDVDLVLLDLSM
ncbi:MAG: response regulator transcription factor, partial [Xanthomonadales bacterium]|nr:response regulator transcription factor [Xanthomonadales bacterium]